MAVTTNPMMHFYITNGGVYMGAFSEGNPAIPEGCTPISNPPPLHASQTTADGGVTWSNYP